MRAFAFIGFSACGHRLCGADVLYLFQLSQTVEGKPFIYFGADPVAYRRLSAVVAIFTVFKNIQYENFRYEITRIGTFGTGYLYERDRNIWGAALIHFVIGFMPRALGLK